MPVDSPKAILFHDYAFYRNKDTVLVPPCDTMAEFEEKAAAYPVRNSVNLGLFSGFLASQL